MLWSFFARCIDNLCMAQENGYEEESYNNYDDSRYNKYPTKVNKYECQIGLSKVSS